MSDPKNTLSSEDVRSIQQIAVNVAAILSKLPPVTPSLVSYVQNSVQKLPEIIKKYKDNLMDALSTRDLESNPYRQDDEIISAGIKDLIVESQNEVSREGIMGEIKSGIEVFTGLTKIGMNIADYVYDELHDRNIKPTSDVFPVDRKSDLRDVIKVMYMHPDYKKLIVSCAPLIQKQIEKDADATKSTLDLMQKMGINTSSTERGIGSLLITGAAFYLGGPLIGGAVYQYQQRMKEEE